MYVNSCNVKCKNFANFPIFESFPPRKSNESLQQKNITPLYISSISLGKLLSGLTTAIKKKIDFLADLEADLSKLFKHLWSRPKLLESHCALLYNTFLIRRTTIYWWLYDKLGIVSAHFHKIHTNWKPLG